MKKIGKTPVRVLEYLKIVRDSGLTNMLDHRNVCNLIGDDRVVCWLKLNKKNYGSVLMVDFSEYLKNG